MSDKQLKSRKVEGLISAAEMDAICPDHRWSDGRIGYMWCRFDAMLDPLRRLRAEVTWDDDGDFEDNEDGAPRVFFDAELFLETNRPEGPCLVTFDGIKIKLSREKAISLVMSDPARILDEYSAEIATLEIWRPEVAR